MSDHAPPNRLVLRAQLRSLLWQMIAAVVPHALAKPLEMTVTQGSLQAQVTIGPAGQTSEKATYPGAHLGTQETAIWLALKERPLNARRIARALGKPYSPSLRTTLANLVERGVLTLSTATGYARAQS